MDSKKTSREGKEALYIKEMTSLQNYWGNPIDSDWDFIKEWSDNDLETNIKDTIGQLKFEKTILVTGMIIKAIIGIFILFGIIGLLLFGIKQLF
ncbi:MAG: hypothetical protein COU32_02555 [Candidatus Magasanikbacteria bacterium CG10_big_fil_rev_8_21_14_0_10_42_10]|uniref:Uncharacterized protein n=2 Tax=Candidatus Magasanikiibacteriota TaxID=1752731 RepID=A0A2H0TW19_9BACT|nr:MAG: hypothetical protein COU32_02555 [Candidatus Magasanikbacteria bacterium CG10_big_fil_rev_8_21_14_0_10_42_10]PIZ93472.1 MAG: hypothetical protein COX82_02560 [Candidatus Magasanikbacteria bacterium CG_4_10_14_0_2_um_filter_41_10]